ncbi:hypothetical protein ALI22I_02685 [Saccharothrix sp. ALI-22-I]|uniref:LuxR C-terminal-related transcriptional regulator n=1 Tax=Saccharothrix sp. ALI-22-I TaxID=1933778 RepID=UPI00097CB255|nr:LuxR C-terminal-related transcriptional regulator [Saccharothrix sp. ALI-22-I]ONI92666.1 hypothetical protein ALI22I_02685 [Saccharothrix sp. ALI-22-I]
MPSTSAVLPDRRTELAAVFERLEQVARGANTAIVVAGGPGMGKSTLLRQSVEAALERGFHVVRNLPDHSGVEVLGELPVSFSEEGCRFPVARLPRWLDDLSDSRRPVLVALDDFEKLPDSAQRTLDGLASAAASVLWIATTCAEHVELAERLDAVTIELAPWSSATVAERVVDRFGAPPGRHLVQLLRRAAGVPAFVVALLEGLEVEGRLRVAEGEVRLRSTQLPGRVHELVHRRLNSLSSKAWQVLRVASMLGRHFELSQVSDLLGERTAMLLPELDEILAAGVLRSEGDCFAFQYDLVWEVVVESIPKLVRRALSDDIDRARAGHDDATPRGQVRAVEAEETARGSHAVLAVGALAASGRYAEAVEVARDTLAHPVNPTSAAELRGLLAHLVLWRGDAKEAVALANEVVAEGSAPDGTAAAAVAVRLLALSLADHRHAQHEAGQVLAARTPAGSTDALMATAVLADTGWAAGDLVGGLGLARDAVREGREHPWWGAWLSLGLADKLGQLGEFGEAEAVLDSVGRDNDQWTLAAGCGRGGIERARLLVRAGRWSDAVAQVRAALGTAKESGSPVVVPAALAVLAKVALATDDLPAAVQHVRHAAAVAAEASVVPSISCDWADLRLVAATHGTRAAVHALETRLTGLVTSPALFVEEPGAAAWLVALARAVGNTELARTSLDMIEHLATANSCFDAIQTAAAHARGVQESDPDLLDRAARRHVDAWAADQAREDLLALDRPPAAPRHREPEWNRLTDTQRTIALLAGSGLTNQQIANRVLLSPHTVNYHLRGMYRRLGISSRVELARFV